MEAVGSSTVKLQERNVGQGDRTIAQQECCSLGENVVSPDHQDSWDL